MKTKSKTKNAHLTGSNKTAHLHTHSHAYIRAHARTHTHAHIHVHTVCKPAPSVRSTPYSSATTLCGIPGKPSISQALPFICKGMFLMSFKCENNQSASDQELLKESLFQVLQVCLKFFAHVSSRGFVLWFISQRGVQITARVNMIYTC